MSEKSIVIEKTILSSMVSSPTALSQGIESLKVDMFSTELYRNVFQTILELDRKRYNIDPASICNDNFKFTNEIIDIFSVASCHSIDSHIKILMGFYKKRNIYALCQQIQQMNLNPDIEADNVMSELELKTNEINNLCYTSKTYFSAKEIMSETWQEIQDSANGAMKRIDIGIEKFDNDLGGLLPGDLMVIGARPGSGKTALALHIMFYVATLLKKPVLFFSLEMMKTKIIKRMLANHSESELNLIKHGNIQYIKDKLAESTNKIAEMPIFIDDRSTLSAFDIRSNIIKSIKNEGIKLVIIDFLQYIQLPGSGKKYEDITETVKILKSTAKDLKIPIILLSQLSRRAEEGDGYPRIDHLSESGGIETLADIIAMLYKPHKYNKSDNPKEIQFIVQKNKDGKLGTIVLQFEGLYKKFYNETNLTEEEREQNEKYVNWTE
jgi:replicative DNA helicase